MDRIDFDQNSPIQPSSAAKDFSALRSRCEGIVEAVLSDWEKSGLLARKSLRHLFLDKTEELVGAWSADYAALARADLSSAVIARKDLIRCYRSCLSSERAKALLRPESLQLAEELITDLETSMPVATVIDGLRASTVAVKGVKEGKAHDIIEDELPSTSRDDFQALLQHIRSQITQLEPGATFLFNVGSFQHEEQCYIERSQDGKTYRINFYDSAHGSVQRLSTESLEAASSPVLWAPRLAKKVLYRGPEAEQTSPAQGLKYDDSRPLETQAQRQNTCGYQGIKFWTKDRFYARYDDPAIAEHEYKLFIALSGEEPLRQKHKSVDELTWTLSQQKQNLRSRYVLYAELMQNPASYKTACEQAEQALAELKVAPPERKDTGESAQHLEALYQALLSALSGQRVPTGSLKEWNSKESPLLRAVYQRHAQRERLRDASCQALGQLLEHESSAKGRLGRWVWKVSNQRIPVRNIERAFGWRTVESETALQQALSDYQYTDEQIKGMAAYFLKNPKSIELSKVQSLCIEVLSLCLDRNLEEQAQALMELINPAKLSGRYNEEILLRPIDKLTERQNFGAAADLIRRNPTGKAAGLVGKIGAHERDMGRELLAEIVKAHPDEQGAWSPHLQYIYGLLRAGDTSQVAQLMRDSSFQASIRNSGRKDIYRIWCQKMNDPNEEELGRMLPLLLEDLESGQLILFDKWLGQALKDALKDHQNYDPLVVLRVALKTPHMHNVVEALKEWGRISNKDIVDCLPEEFLRDERQFYTIGRWKLWQHIAKLCDHGIPDLDPDTGLRVALAWHRQAKEQGIEAPRPVTDYLIGCAKTLAGKAPSTETLKEIDSLVSSVVWHHDDEVDTSSELELLRQLNETGIQIACEEYASWMQDEDEDYFTILEQASIFDKHQLNLLRPPEGG